MIKNTNKNKIINLLIEKAIFLKNIGEINQATKTYSQAI